MKFENAFLTADNSIGMQFKSKSKQLFTVWMDSHGVIHFTEGFSKKDTEEAISYYNKNFSNFIR